MGEVFFIVSLIAFLILPFLLAGKVLLWWVACMATIGLVVVIYEALSAWLSPEKMTISRRFWKWSTEVDENGKYRNRRIAILILVLLQIGWASLLLHLAWWMITGRKTQK